jgi:hypothetical protein
MAQPLTIEDFKLSSAICEARYENAYLIYDRTGVVAQAIGRTFTNLNVASAAPQQTAFVADEGAFVVELTQARFTVESPPSKLEVLGRHSKTFFDIVAENLEIKVFTRIGLRTLWRKSYETEQDAKAALAAVDLINLKAGPRFGIDGNITEVVTRWEDKQVGTTLHLRAESSQLEMVLPAHFREDQKSPRIQKKNLALLLDIDYYTVAPVERGQWQPAEWLPDKVRLIRKEADKILQGDRK